MAYSESKSPEKVIGQLNAKAKTNREIKKKFDAHHNSLRDIAEYDDTGFGPIYQSLVYPQRNAMLRESQIDPNKGTSLKQLEKKGGRFSNLSPDEEKLMTRAQNAKMKLAATKAAKAAKAAKGKKK